MQLQNYFFPLLAYSSGYPGQTLYQNWYTFLLNSICNNTLSTSIYTLPCKVTKLNYVFSISSYRQLKGSEAGEHCICETLRNVQVY